jgi:hypothetical protein
VEEPHALLGKGENRLLSGGARRDAIHGGCGQPLFGEQSLEQLQLVAGQVVARPGSMRGYGWFLSIRDFDPDYLLKTGY